MDDAQALDLNRLDVAQLALFVGQAADTQLLSALHARGYTGLRISHGYVVQHLVTEPRSVTALAARMAVSQQAASKVVQELVRLGYLEQSPGKDARTRMIALSTRGRAALRTARRLRAALERRLLRGYGQEDVARLRAQLVTLLDQLGGAPLVRARKVREPR